MRPLTAGCLTAALAVTILGPAVAQVAPTTSTPTPVPVAPAPVPAPTSPLDPAALQAIDRMGAYLRTLTSFEVASAAVVEERVDTYGDKVRSSFTTTYRMRRPDAFFVETASRRKLRRYYYDGQSLTVSLPRENRYARAPAPPTIPQALEAAYDRYGLALPLTDIVYWGEKAPPTALFTSASLIGPARIEGIDTDEYRLAGPTLEWRIWIARGPEPTPRKVVLTTLGDAMRPTYSAVLTWRANAAFAPDAFRFTPSAQARAVGMSDLDQ